MNVIARTARRYVPVPRSTVLGGIGSYSLSRRLITTQQLDASKGYRERVVILGSGWAGFNMSRELDPAKFQVVLVSPRPYFVFTPLLASTSVGTLEFRTTIESARSRSPTVQYFQGWADDVDFYNKTVTIEGATHDNELLHLVRDSDAALQKGQTFQMAYDKLVVAVGCYSQTFGTKGVKDNAFFLKDISDARRIRKRILQCFDTAALPTTSPELRDNLLNFAIVGGGPTGVEFAAELYDLCHDDISRSYPDLVKHVQISLYDVAPKILSMFDESLANYAVDKFKRDGIKVKTQHHIEELRRGTAETSQLKHQPTDCFTLKTTEDGEVAVGMCVWSTGLMMNPFIQQTLSSIRRFPTKSAAIDSPSGSPSQSTVTAAATEQMKWIVKRHPKTGGLLVDDQFHVQIAAQEAVEESQKNTSPSQSLAAATPTRAAAATAIMRDVFALGDVASMEKAALPATAQVASQESKWLTKRLNRGDLDRKHFEFRNLGIMTYLGGFRAIMQTERRNEIRGIAAWIIWRGAYLTKTISWRNKLLIPIYWTINFIFGRDISRF